MNFLIKLAARAISRRIEAGSSLGAKIGSVIGVLVLGGLGAAGWISGVTGFMGAGFTLAGVLGGAIGGALLGARLGPEDRLIHGAGQDSIRVNDYNRKLVPLVPMAASLAVSIFAFSLWFNGWQGADAVDRKNALMVCIVALLIVIGICIYIAGRDLSISFGQTIRVNRLFGHRVYEYSAIRFWGVGVLNQYHPPYPKGAVVAVLIRVPDGELVMPLKSGQGEELYYFLDEVVPAETNRAG